MTIPECIGKEQSDALNRLLTGGRDKDFLKKVVCCCLFPLRATWCVTLFIFFFKAKTILRVEVNTNPEKTDGCS